MSKRSLADPANRKDRIVEAALKLYAKQGVGGTRMAEVAKRAGVDPPLVLYYFKEADSLYEAVVLKVLESLKEASLRPLENLKAPLIKRFEGYIEAPFRWAAEHPDYMSLWMYFYYMATFSSRFQNLNELVRTAGRERIQSLIYQGLELKQLEVPKGLSVHEVATAIQGLMTGATIMAASEAKGDYPMFRENTRKMIAVWLGRKT